MTVGNLITIAVYLGMMLVGLVRLQAAEDQLRVSIERLGAEVEAIKKDYRTVAVDTEYRRRVMDRLEDLKQRLNRVEASVR